MSNYKILLKILDKLRKDAPIQYSKYHPDEKDTIKLNQARSKAFIHLFLKVNCGLISFKERDFFITEGGQDGGIDAYYIDDESKKFILIQSKFRTTENNFTAKSMTADDLVKMEIKRILGGEKQDSRGVNFSAKILQLQKKWSEVRDQANYETKVIFLGNLKNYTDEQIRKLIDNYKYEIFGFKRTYAELIFPLCSGTYYDPKEIELKINLLKKQQPNLNQEIVTSYGPCEVTLVFVPAREIGEVLHKYKNSLLKYNPRNYLSISKNTVNQKIRESIMSNDSNDFSIFNNGITILVQYANLTTTTGVKGKGQLILKKPQIINGGQTAYTLSRIYADNISNDLDKIFDNKEVLLKIISLNDLEEIDRSEIKFIEEISNATNQQTSVDEADRRSNDEIQISIQNKIFEEYGFYYERKRGEFFVGKGNQYLDEDNIIDRYSFIRSYCAYKGNPSNARRSGNEIFFRYKRFKEILGVIDDYKLMFLAYIVFYLLKKIELAKNKNEWSGLSQFEKIDYGNGLRYGKFSIISALGRLKVDLNKLVPEEILKYTKELLLQVLKKWKDFETHVMTLDNNEDYFSEEYTDFDNYYKGKTIDEDIESFFPEED